MFLKRLTGSVIAAAMLLAAGCSGANATLPSASSPASASLQSLPSGEAVALAKSLRPADTTSILKKLKKTVEIGSTVDPTNGDEGPHSLMMSNNASSGLVKKGDFVVCDFSDKNGNAGAGTSVEIMGSTPGSKPATFAQSSTIAGCDGAAIMSDDEVYVTGLTSKSDCAFTASGKAEKCYKNPPTDPIADAYGAPPPGSQGFYSPYFQIIGDLSGKVELFSLGIYGQGKIISGITGFPVTKTSGFNTLGPSGFAYDNDNPKGGTLYVVDGACNAVVAIDKMPDVLVPNEITINKACTKFKCKDKKATCGTVVKVGSPLDKPYAAAILPNDNIIVANTGSNELVEMTPTGQVLDTKVVDTSKTAGIFGLWASGTNDSNTVVYYTDSNSNTVQEMEK